MYCGMRDKMAVKEKQLDNTNVHYWIHTDSVSDICLFFSHGVTADHRCFIKQEEFFKGEYKMINWDIPMHGMSVKEKFISFEECARLMNAILEKENIDKVVLVGLSLGGYPSQMFANMFPETTLGFIAIDTTPFGTKYYSKTDMFWLKQVGWMAKCFTNKMLKKSMARSVSVTNDSYELMMEMLRDSTKDQISVQMDIAYKSFIVENRDIELDVPVILLLGDHDKTGRIKKYCENWQKETGYPLHIIRNAAHISNSDNSEEVNSIIYNFVKRLSIEM